MTHKLDASQRTVFQLLQAPPPGPNLCRRGQSLLLQGNSSLSKLASIFDLLHPGCSMGNRRFRTLTSRTTVTSCAQKATCTTRHCRYPQHKCQQDKVIQRLSILYVPRFERNSTCSIIHDSKLSATDAYRPAPEKCFGGIFSNFSHEDHQDRGGKVTQ